MCSALGKFSHEAGGGCHGIADMDLCGGFSLGEEAVLAGQLSWLCSAVDVAGVARASRVVVLLLVAEWQACIGEIVSSYMSQGAGYASRQLVPTEVQRVQLAEIA